MKIALNMKLYNGPSKEILVFYMTIHECVLFFFIRYFQFEKKKKNHLTDGIYEVT